MADRDGIVHLGCVTGTALNGGHVESAVWESERPKTVFWHTRHYLCHSHSNDFSNERDGDQENTARARIGTLYCTHVFTNNLVTELRDGT